MNRLRYIRAMLGAGLLFLASAGYGAERPFVFTAIPDQDENRLQERFDRFAAYLTEQLGTEVRYVPVKSYSAAVTAFRNDDVQLAWFGGLSGVQARSQVPGSRAIAQGYEDQFFVTYFIAHESTGLENSEQFPAGIADRNFTFGSMGSTSGRLMPEHYIRQELGESPQEAFSRVGFSGNHSRTIALVQSGAYEVGAVNYQVWESELEAGIIDPQRVKVVWETPPYPDYHWTIRGDVNETWGDGFIDEVRAALLELEDRDLLDLFPRSGFVAADNDDYQEILEVGRSIDLLD